MISKKLLNLANLLEASILYINKIIKVIIILKDKNLMFAAFYIIILYLKSFDNSYKFILINLILYLY